MIQPIQHYAKNPLLSLSEGPCKTLLRSTIAELSSLLTPRTSQGLILKPRAAIVSSKAATKIHRTLETIHECNSGCPSHKFMKDTFLHQIVHLHDQDAPRTDCLQY